jgi:adenylate cyclase
MSATANAPPFKAPAIGPVAGRSSMSPAAPARANRLLAEFAAEEGRGLKLAFRLRMFALVAIALFLPVITPWPGVLYYHGLLLGFVATGALSLLPGRGGARGGPAAWVLWLVPLADLALVTFAVVYPTPLGGEEFLTAQLRLRMDNTLFLALFIAFSTLTYSPRKVIWTGIAAILCWAVATLWVASLPDSIFATSRNPQWLAMTIAEQRAAFSNPDTVPLPNFLKQEFVLAVITCILAVAVARSRRLLLRQVRVEAERAQLARYFSPNLVDQLADADRPLGEVRTQ